MNAQKNDLYIIGAGGHAKVIIDLIETSTSLRISGLFDDKVKKGQGIFGYDILGPISALQEIKSNCDVILAIGDNDARNRTYQKIVAWNQSDEMNKNISFPTLVHHSGVISPRSQIGDGTIVTAGAIIGPDAIIGNHCIVNTGATIDHECVLGDFSSVAPGVHLGGKVSIGDHTFIGIGASVIHGVKIGADVVVGAGSVVTKDVPSGVVCYGVPAKIIKQRKRGESYL